MTDKRSIPHYLFLPAMMVLLMLFFVGCGEKEPGDGPAGYKNVLNIHADALSDFSEGTFKMEDYVTGEYTELQSEYITYGFLESLILNSLLQMIITTDSWIWTVMIMMSLSSCRKSMMMNSSITAYTVWMTANPI